MSIESIIIVFSLGLLASIIIILVAGLIYSKFNKVKPEEIYPVPLQQERYIPNSPMQVGFSKYASPGRLSNYPVVNPGRRQNLSNGNFKFNGHTHPAHSSFYKVVNSSQLIPYLNKQNFN